jgi:hypothetical protein
VSCQHADPQPAYMRVITGNMRLNDPRFSRPGVRGRVSGRLVASWQPRPRPTCVFPDDALAVQGQRKDNARTRYGSQHCPTTPGRLCLPPVWRPSRRLGSCLLRRVSPYLRGGSNEEACEGCEDIQGEMRASDSDPARSPEARAKRPATNARRRQEALAWEQMNPGPHDQEVYNSEILPRLRKVTLPQKMQATGLTSGYCLRSGGVIGFQIRCIRKLSARLVVNRPPCNGTEFQSKLCLHRQALGESWEASTGRVPTRTRDSVMCPKPP